MIRDLEIHDCQDLEIHDCHDLAIHDLALRDWEGGSLRPTGGW